MEKEEEEDFRSGGLFRGGRKIDRIGISYVDR